MRNEFVFGIEEAKAVLDGIRSSLADQLITPAAKKALKPVKAAAKARINAEAKSSDRPFSKARFISRGIIITRISKAKGGGARVGVRKMDIQMNRGKRWNLAGAAKLYGRGSYLTPDRQGHGEFKGFGNFIAEEGNRYKGAVSRHFKRYLYENIHRKYSRIIKK